MSKQNLGAVFDNEKGERVTFGLQRFPCPFRSSAIKLTRTTNGKEVEQWFTEEEFYQLLSLMDTYRALLKNRKLNNY